MFVTVFPEKVELLTVMMPKLFCTAPPVLLATLLEKVLFSTVTVARVVVDLQVLNGCRCRLRKIVCLCPQEFPDLTVGHAAPIGLPKRKTRLSSSI